MGAGGVGAVIGRTGAIADGADAIGTCTVAIVADSAVCPAGAMLGSSSAFQYLADTA